MNISEHQIESDNLLHQLFTTCVKLSDTGFNTGKWNMDFDRDLLFTVAESNKDFHDIFFRTYGWKPWAVSLGANQKESDIDIKLLHDSGYDLVRRLTGGRAVFHANEITYSIVMQIPDSITIHDIYRVSHQFILRGLQSLGSSNLSFQRTQPSFSQVYKTAKDNVSCFASSARYEIMLDQRKVVGSAQRVYKNTLLQHGSILMGSGHEKLPLFFNSKIVAEKDSLLSALSNSTATLEQVLEKSITYNECSTAILSSF